MHKKIVYVILYFLVFFSLCHQSVYAATGTVGITYMPGTIEVDITPGKHVTINQPIRVISTSDTTRHVVLTLMKPKNFKEGRSTLPDFSWVTFSKTEFDLEPHRYKEVYINIFIPKKPENYNGHWEVWIKAIAEKKSGEQELFNIECIGRLLINTPKNIPLVNIDIVRPLLIGIVAATVFIIGGVIIYKRKNHM